jgi:uncharacterized protein
MKLPQEFTIAHPLDEVWRFFRDVPRVAGCLPGVDGEAAAEASAANTTAGSPIGALRC